MSNSSEDRGGAVVVSWGGIRRRCDWRQRGGNAISGRRCGNYWLCHRRIACGGYNVAPVFGLGRTRRYTQQHGSG